MKAEKRKGECFIEYLEGFLSLILGLIAGIFIAIGAVIGGIFLLLGWLIGTLIALLIPSLRYKIKLKRMLRDADDKKEAKLRTGLFSRYELKGSEFDSLFTGMKSCIATFKKQSDQRIAVLRRRPELDPVFKQYDELFAGFQKQFYLSAETVEWKKVDVYNYNGIPAYPVLKKALTGMQTLTERQQAILNGAVADEISELELMQSVTESVMLPEDLADPQQTQQMQ